MSNESLQWLTTNAEFLSKLFGAGLAISGGIVGFYKLIKYLVKHRKRTDEKLDAISKTLADQHSKDFQEVKETLNQFKSSIELVFEKVGNLNERVDRVDKNIESINNNILTFKGAIDSNMAIVGRNSEKLRDVEDDVEDHESRIFMLEVKPTEAKSRATRRKSKSKRKKVR